MTDGLRNIQAAADWLGIPASTLEKLVTQRKVPFTRPGGTKHIRFSPEHLAAIVAMGEELPGKAIAALVRLTHPPAGPVNPTPPAGPKTEPRQGQRIA